METGFYRMAGLNMELGMSHPRVLERFRPWKIERADTVQIRMKATPEKIAEEQAEDEGRPVPVWIREMNALYRGICEQLPAYGGMLMHSSALMMDGRGYLFAGLSGAGKSTHARMWRETFGERVVMINDDKPLLRNVEDGSGGAGRRFWVYGTPIDGKHHLSANTEAPLCGICFIRQGEKNVIRRMLVNEALPGVMEQIYRCDDMEYMVGILELTDELFRQVPVYELTCTVSHEAAEIAYRKLKEDM